MKLCINCGIEIPAGRLKALPNTETCTGCSNTAKKVGFQILDGKTTYSELEIVYADSNTAKDFNRMKRTGFHATFLIKSPFEKNLKLNEI